jgi:hypothetical protein
MFVEERRAFVRELAATGPELSEKEIAESVRANWHHPDDVARIRSLLMELTLGPEAVLEDELAARGLIDAARLPGVPISATVDGRCP